MSRIKEVTRMANAFKACQRPWKDALPKRGDKVLIEGHPGLHTVWSISSPHRRRYTQVYVSVLRNWFYLNRVTRW